MTKEEALERLNKMANWLEKFCDPDQPNREENLKDLECIFMAIEAIRKEMTYGYCVYHEIECDYKGNCIDCLYNTEEDTEWFRKDEEKAESEE